ncbi:hypothetical protein LCGC14_2007100 [marine sediment metagenome]|uniref:Uncharacterized protein n=1 Tax=marine sediment metagenome TaxID=412755 RepID=A0A0F9FNZ2_9ZZZZ
MMILGIGIVVFGVFIFVGSVMIMLSKTHISHSELSFCFL